MRGAHGTSAYCTKHRTSLVKLDTAARGAHAEDLALAYLLGEGLLLVERNVRSRRGELDLVMRDGGTLVFVEVRQRSGARFGGAAASIGPVKQARLWRAAQVFLLRYPTPPPCRFDAVCIDGDQLQWLRHILVR